MTWHDPRHWTWTGAAALAAALIVIVIIGLFTDAVHAAPDLVRYAFILGAVLFVVPSSAVYGFWGKRVLGWPRGSVARLCCSAVLRGPSPTHFG